jgi:hypothetical protein
MAKAFAIDPENQQYRHKRKSIWFATIHPLSMVIGVSIQASLRRIYSLSTVLTVTKKYQKLTKIKRDHNMH